MNPKLQIAAGAVLTLIGIIKAGAVVSAFFGATSAYSAGYATGLLVAAILFLAGGLKLFSRGWTKHKAASLMSPAA